MKLLKKYAPLLLLLMLMAVASYFIDANTIKDFKEFLTTYSQNNLTASALLYFAVYAVCVALSLPIATVLTLLAGVIFSPILGTIIVVTGATLGAVIIFLIVKNTSISLDKYKNSKPLLTLQKNLKEDAASYLLFARLVPIFPFVLVNIAPATVGIKLKTFLWTTFVGIAPGSFIYTYLGYQSGNIDSVKDLVSVEMLSALVLLGLFSLTPIIIKKRLKK